MKSKSTIKLPGLVDVHVHLRDPGATHKEDFATGTMAAVAGGYTQILDMPNNPEPTVTSEALEKKIDLTQGVILNEAKDLDPRIYCDVGFNFGATRESIRYFPKIIPQVFGLKVYMNHTTGPLLVEEQADRELIFKSWPGPLPIMVHAEGETVEAAIKLARKYQKRLHVCHVTADQIGPIEKGRKAGVALTCEVCPHHLFLSEKDLKRLGPFGLMKPPLPTKKEQEKLWESLDKIDIIATDHAPHTREEKLSSSPPFGVPGLETMLPLMLNAVWQKRLTLDRLIEMTSTRPRKIFNLPSQPDTYIEVATDEQYTINDKQLFTRSHWTPFVGLQGRGVVKKVVLRGKTIFENGQFVSLPSGQVMSR